MSGAGQNQSGVISVRSRLSLAETIKNLLIAIERRGMTVFARIDHAKAAGDTGPKLRPEQLFVFGYPEAEAPLIEIIPLFGLDFPQRVLLWEDEQSGVWLSYNDPVWIGRRHGAGAGLFPKPKRSATRSPGLRPRQLLPKAMSLERDVPALGVELAFGHPPERRSLIRDRNKLKRLTFCDPRLALLLAGMTAAAIRGADRFANPA